MPDLGGWNLGQFGMPSQSTMPLSPQQVQQIHAMTSAMQQPAQQQPSGMFGPQGNLGQNLGSMTQAFVGGPSYGGGNIFTDAYGGSAAAPLPGLTAADYG
jgi:hypothetical protein